MQTMLTCLSETNPETRKNLEEDLKRNLREKDYLKKESQQPNNQESKGVEHEEKSKPKEASSPPKKGKYSSFIIDAGSVTVSPNKVPWVHRPCSDFHLLFFVLYIKLNIMSRSSGNE